MASALTAKAKILLTQQNDALLINENATTTKIETVRHIVEWGEHEDIKPGKWIVQNKKYRFTREGIDKIRNAYFASMGEDIFEDFSQDNHQSASNKSADEKQGKIKPTHHLILAAVTETPCFEQFQQEFYLCQQMNVELDIGEVDFSIYDSLLMIENRDSFNDWHLYLAQTPIELGKVLVIYRGDSHYSVAATTLLKHWRDSRPEHPVIYFGDFDLSGIRLAISGECTHLLLPTRHWLETHLIPQHYPYNQEKLLAGLERDCPEGWQSLLQLMSGKRAGLRQQKMYETPLILHVNGV
jgi:hypothetical protein